MMFWKPAVPFLPKENRRITLFPLVLGVMAYITALALAVMLGLSGAIGEWTSSLQGTLTVQVVNADAGVRDEQAAHVLDALKNTPGVRSAYRLSGREIADLLEPWIGKGNVTADLPVPAMISVTFKEGARPDAAALRALIQSEAPDARLDDHQLWLDDIYSLANTLKWTAGAILGLVLATAAIMVVFGTRSELAAHLDWVEIMHLMGASDSMIASAFQSRYFLHGLKGGLIGLGLAAVTLYGLSQSILSFSRGLLPEMRLSTPQWLILLALPAFFALLATLTARIASLRALKAMP